MMHWFVWKNQNSFSDYGLWINKMPSRTRGEERYEEIQIPGRAGSLIMLEGDDVYSSFTSELTVICRNDIDIDRAIAWLRGSSELLLSTDINKARKARILGEVSFERIDNNLLQATIPFFCEPFKYNKHGDDVITLSGSKIINNPGDVASKPIITLTRTGALTITIGDSSMVFDHLPGAVTIDCDTQIIKTRAYAFDSSKYYYVNDYATYTGDETYSAGLYRFTSEGVGSEQSWEKVEDWDGNTYHYVWQGSFSGEFIKIKPGDNNASITNSITATIKPNWRWL